MTDTAPPTPPIRRALLSVSNKQGIVEFARALAEHGVHLLSTGGTARTLRDAGLDVTLVEDHTGFPEMLDGRVKTLHPTIHGGILGVRDNPEHTAKMAEHQIEPIDLVCIDLYKFEDTIARAGVTLDDAVEQIDIGGPAMLRSAAKNFRFVTVVSDPAQYTRVLAEIAEQGGTTTATRMDLAATAYERTCAFDAAISTYLRAQQGEAFPRVLLLQGELASTLRYGENPHQPAALYRSGGFQAPDWTAQLHGKPLSYNNLLDASAAFELALALAALDEAAHAACVIKHTNPCGAALAGSPAEAFDLAIAGDPMAAYGGIAASGSVIDTAAAERLCGADRFFEVVIAPDYTDEALALLRERWKNIRLLRTNLSPEDADAEALRSVGSRPTANLDIRTIPGGFLVQAHDDTPPAPAAWTHAAGPVPDPALLRAAAVMEATVRALSSNAIAIGGPVEPRGTGFQPVGCETRGTGFQPVGCALFGGGAGQMDRVASCRLAIAKAGDRARGAVAASDAFFPFPDGPELLADAGVAMLVHPGGSKRDSETFELCDRRGITCMTTGVRRFRH
ncbi:MAG: bifunctional phosphoribosylaminoimidazolecarboxamide formyltransferase/IMP cyclohydrolase [Planctomycetota bacterium]|nr:bifunctional phosphoribosylaminoimidazolecarboxamide formyltransferase/IMP cyclohydrolase [Planctomycetota bacterium]